MAIRPGSLGKNCDLFQFSTGTYRPCPQILFNLHKAGLAVNLEICCFFAISIGYLGHIICQKRFELASHAIDTISRLKATKIIADFRAFLRFSNVFLQFASILARLATP